jgi:O-antigen ligase
VAASVPFLPTQRVNLNSIGTAGVVGALALTWTLPFLWTAHWYPLPALYSELVAAACLAFGMLSCGLLKRADARLHWPLPALLLGLAALALLQDGLGLLAYSQLAVRFVLCMLTILAAYVFGRQIVALKRTEEAFGLLSAACLLGAIFSVLVQWLQLFDLEVLPFWMAPVFKGQELQGRPFGNLAQANHQATYLALAALSAAYLGRISRRGWLAPSSLLILASGMGLTGSRMGAAFLALVMVLQFAPTALRPDAVRGRWLAGLAVIAGYAVAVVAVRLVVGQIDALARPLGIRYELWWQAWRIALDHPWLGIGVDQFGGGQYLVARAGPYMVAANNAHNLILNVAVEFGWPAAIATGGVGLQWGLTGLRQRLASPGHVLAWGMLLMIAIHSMLEFPLWYLFFSIPAALLFALGEPDRAGYAVVDLRRVLPAGGFVTIAIMLMYSLGYREIADAAAPQWLEAKNIRKRTALDALPLLAVADAKLFKPEVDRLLLDLKHPPDEDTPNAQLDRSARVLRILPAPEIMTQHIVQLAKVGRIDDAIAHVDRLRIYAGTAYPSYRDSILDQTRDLGPQTAPLRHALRANDFSPKARIAH